MRRTIAATMALALVGAGALGGPADAKPRRGEPTVKRKREKRLGAVRGPVRLGFGLGRSARPAPGARAPGAPRAPQAVHGTTAAAIALPGPGPTGGGQPTAPPLAPSTPDAGSPPVPGTAAPAPAPAPRPPLARALSVRSREFSFTLSRPLVGAGEVAVEFNNSVAEDPHDLHLVRSDGTGPSRFLADALPGEVVGADAELAPGTYELYCSLSGHRALGMRATLRVEAG